jgi:hypothetical protein
LICRLWRGSTTPENADAYQLITVLKRFGDRAAHYEVIDRRAQ